MKSSRLFVLATGLIYQVYPIPHATYKSTGFLLPQTCAYQRHQPSDELIRKRDVVFILVRPFAASPEIY